MPSKKDRERQNKVKQRELEIRLANEKKKLSKPKGLIPRIDGAGNVIGYEPA